MIKKLIALSGVLAAILAQSPAAFAADATVTVHGSGVGVGLGNTRGNGVLTYKGYDIPFTWSNFTLGKLGVTVGDATGEVNDLAFLEKFNGCYSNSDADVTLLSGGFSKQLKNKSGVVVNLKGKEKGLDVSLTAGCAKVTMDPKVLASVLEKLKVPPVAANYSNSIYFDTNSESIKSSEHGKLDSVIAELEKTPGTEVIVTGYTDTTGSEGGNQKLSEERADAVVEALTSRAKNTKVTELPPQRVVVSGKGQVDGPKDKADQANRRVDIMIIQPNAKG